MTRIQAVNHHSRYLAAMAPAANSNPTIEAAWTFLYVPYAIKAKPMLEAMLRSSCP